MAEKNVEVAVNTSIERSFMWMAQLDTADEGSPPGSSSDSAPSAPAWSWNDANRRGFGSLKLATEKKRSSLVRMTQPRPPGQNLASAIPALRASSPIENCEMNIFLNTS